MNQFQVWNSTIDKAAKIGQVVEVIDQARGKV